MLCCNISNFSFDTYCISKKHAAIKKWLSLILQTSGKTSTDRWETSRDEWTQMRVEIRSVQKNERRMLFYHLWIQSLPLFFLLRKEHVNLRSGLASNDESKTNEKWVQTSEDEWETSWDECRRIRDECYSIIHKSRVSYCFYFKEKITPSVEAFYYELWSFPS